MKDDADVQVVVVGGGPGGLAAGLAARLAGASALVLERQAPPPDKACGEGLMPSGLEALEALGVRRLLSDADAAPFDSIAYVQDGARAVAQLPAPGGLGIRRVGLVEAMLRRADEVGLAVHHRTRVTGYRVDEGGVTVDTNHGPVRARLLVAADGLHSPIRKASGLERPGAGHQRFGMRQHFARAAWSSAVEVHFTQGCEAYVTPAGRGRVGVAFLWHDGALEEKPSFESLLRLFPEVARHVAGVAPDSEVRGAGPLRQVVARRTDRRLVLLGDASGYVDAITGEGLSIAFQQARTLARHLPTVLADGGSVESLAPYEEASARVFRRYALVAGGLVEVAARPWLRRPLVGALAAQPWLFTAAVRAVAAGAPELGYKRG